MIASPLVCLSALALLVAAPLAAAPPQEPTPAEAARRAREQRRPAEERKVWTNENLPRTGGAVSVVGAAPAAPADPAAPAPELSDEEQAVLNEEREALLAELDERQAALQRERSRQNLLQRDYDLRREQFYSNPAHSTDSAGLAALDLMARELEDQGRTVEELEQQVAELERRLAELDHDLGPRPEEELTPEQQREQWRSRLMPLREELQRVEAELARLRGTTTGADVGLVGVPTVDRTDQLTRRREELRQQIAAIEDEARRAGVPPAWLR
jgi:DNA repair exonuclease SbcCD ATPase subunit